MLNACGYVLQNRCAWLLPKRFPPLHAAYVSFTGWPAPDVLKYTRDRVGMAARRHIVICTFALLLAVTATVANAQVRDAGPKVVALTLTRVPELKRLYANGAYGRRCTFAIEQNHGISVEAARHPGNRAART